MDESIANDRFGNRSEQTDAKPQVVEDLDERAGGRFLKAPDDIHPLGPRFQVVKANLATLAIDDLLGCPGDREAETSRRHHDKVAIRAAFEITDVTIMRQNFRPELEVRRGLKDQRLRRGNGDGVCRVHDRSSGYARVKTGQRKEK